MISLGFLLSDVQVGDRDDHTQCDGGDDEGQNNVGRKKSEGEEEQNCEAGLFAGVTANEFRKGAPSLLIDKGE